MTSSDFNPSDHLTSQQLVDRWRDTPFPVSLITLSRWRTAGKGPYYIRAGHCGARVYYPLHSIVEWENNLIIHPQHHQ